MNVTAQEILSLAEKEIGYKEGSNNDNKFGKAYGVNNVPWCMQFVWYIFSKINKDLFYGGNKCASCHKLMEYALKNNQWVSSNYKPGDVLIFDFPTEPSKTDHTGFCEKVDSNYVYTIEGNTSSGEKGSQSNGDGVYRRKRKLSHVLGAYRPKYTEIEEVEDLDLSEFKILWKELRKELQDNDSSEYSKEAREWAVSNGLVAGGNSEAFNGMWEDVLTREQFVTVLFRFYKMISK